MKSPMCKICDHPHRLGDPHVLPDANHGEVGPRHKPRVRQEQGQATQDMLLIARPLSDFLYHPELVEQLSSDAINILYRGTAKMVMRAKRGRT